MQWTDESIAFLRDAAAMNRYYETIAEKITPQLQENAHVCDAGCGIGELSLALKPYCRHVTAVDADELAIKTLKAHLIKGVTAICGDVEALTPKEPYDAMVFCLFGRTEDTLRIARKQCRTKRRCACSPLRRRLFRRRKQYETASFDLRERGVGKSTLIRRLLEKNMREVGGFVTKRLPIADENGFFPIYLYPASQKEDERHNEAANLVGTCDSRSSIRHPEVFDTLGAQLIESAPEGGIILMDELGFLENDARAFQSAVLCALDGETPVLAAVKPKDTPFLRAVRGHENAELVFIDEQNRDALLEKLLPHILRWNEA